MKGSIQTKIGAGNPLKIVKGEFSCVNKVVGKTIPVTENGI